MSYEKNAQVDVLPVVDLCKKSAKWHYFCGRCNTGVYVTEKTCGEARPAVTFSLSLSALSLDGE